MIIATERLTLRPFTPADAPAISALAGDPRVAGMLVDIPLPFDQAAAGRWLQQSWGELRLGIERDGKLIGGVCYFCHLGSSGSLGYWLGTPYWGNGYALEAAAALVQFGFAQERLRQFSSAHFIDNPASGRVLQKLGFQRRGKSTVWCQARGERLPSALYTLSRTDAGFAPAWPTVAGMLGFRPLTVGRSIGRSRQINLARPPA